MPARHLLLDTQRIDIPPVQREVLQARPDTLADQFADGAINDSQLRRGTSILAQTTHRHPTGEAAHSPVAGLLTAAEGGRSNSTAWTPPPCRPRADIDQLIVATVNAVGRCPRLRPHYRDRLEAARTG
jgi:hypothetical protein